METRRHGRMPGTSSRDTAVRDPFIRPEFFEEEFWLKNLRRFVTYARGLMARRSTSLAGVPEPADYVSLATELILTGRRRCPDDVESGVFVLGVLRSLISHDCDRRENRHERASITTIPDEMGNVGINELQIPDLSAHSLEEMAIASQLADRFLGSIPSTYRRYVELRISDPDGPAAEHAKRLNLDISEVQRMKKVIRRLRPLWNKPELIEIPLLPATVLDSVLSGDDGTMDAVRKLRQELRKELGSSDRGGFVSFGRGGSMNLEPTPLFTCLVTGTVWGRKRARLVADAYRDAGLGKLLSSKRFIKAQTIAAKKLQQSLPLVVGSNVMNAAIGTLFDLTTTDSCLHEVAKDMRRITDVVNDEVPQLKRIRGRIIRFDGDEALVVLERNGREELHELPSSLLLSTGLSSNGRPFMLHEMMFSADRRAQIAVPAIDLERELTAGELHELAAGDVPLPRP